MRFKMPSKKVKLDSPSLYENCNPHHANASEDRAERAGLVYDDAADSADVGSKSSLARDVAVTSKQIPHCHLMQPISSGTGESPASPTSSPTSRSEDAVSPGRSPQTNRDKFKSACAPVKIDCSLTHPGLSDSTLRHNLRAIVFIVYPASEKPDRRHVLLIDEHGVTGITVWANHVNMFSQQTVGQVVQFSKLTVAMHNGKRTVAMSRDSHVQLLDSAAAAATPEWMWWNGLRSMPPLRIIDAHKCSDDAVISVSGILGMMSTETKKVRSDNRSLLTMRIVDSTGMIDIRSWSKNETDFTNLVDQPIVLHRVRISSFAGTTVGEILDGDGTLVKTNFLGSDDLRKFWAT
jgi:hypothetical protein